MSGAASVAQQAAWSASSSASVSRLMASWPGGYFDDSATVATVRSCGNLVKPNCHVVINGLVALRCSGAQRRVSAPAWTVDVVPGR